MSNLSFEAEGRFLSLRGPYVNSLGTIEHPLVTKDLSDNRRKRDGPTAGYHITVVNHLEIKSFLPDTELNERGEEVQLSLSKKKKLFRKHQMQLLKQVYEKFGNADHWEKPRDLGLGICKKDNAVSYYRVIFWPFGQEIRRFLGLPPCNFHITVGFTPQDIHLYKGPGSLLCLQGISPCSNRELCTLIDFLPFYTEDFEFLKNLYWVCCKYRYYMAMGHLIKVTFKCRLTLADVSLDFV
ncbi:hypothetical protein BDF20DRAFT_915391 [Mycotypha africana]|uniref:uncharacterized protein n=1 Tax=Mycotypha africana TaxID=64632 RepID=UPI002300FCB7|nr:uncharacterized protein BDF20DRAFT_915391 [Mycotypha africana]KAI8971602.1 hypothetical protein BDF20DRAFT_915391 [Mycotypha africana]